MSANEMPDLEVDIGPLPPRGAWWEAALPPCPDCSGVITWYEAQYVPGARKCTQCGSMFSIEVRHPVERSVLRKVDLGDGEQAVYRIPCTGHWANWHDPDTIVLHGVLIASRDSDGGWHDAAGTRTPETLEKRFEELESIGASKRRLALNNRPD